MGDNRVRSSAVSGRNEVGNELNMETTGVGGIVGGAAADF